MAVSQKLIERLKAFELQNKHSVALAELIAKADKEEAEGFKGDHLAIRRKVFDELVKLLPGEVEWVEPYFFRGPVVIEDYTDYSAERLPDGNRPTIQKPSMSFDWRGGNFQFTGPLSSFHPIWSIDYEWSGTSTWRKTRTNVVRIYVGDFGSKRMFKQLKDGGHRYADIASAIADQAAARWAMIKMQQTQNKNKSAVQEVIDGIDDEIKSYNGVRIEASPNAALPVFVTLDKKMSMTSAAAIELLNMLKKHGIG